MPDSQAIPPDNQATPKVSIGLPVYNGERYVEEAIDSILAQTFSDFELIISDNASTDRTEEICRHYASRDPRIRYHRQPTNVGAVANFNRAFELSAGGKYFKWAAYDDWIAPTYLEACVRELESQPEAAVCHSFAEIVDGDGHHMKYKQLNAGGELPRASDRFDAQLNRKFSTCIEIFGVIRSDVLTLIGPMRGHKAADRTMLLELAMCGRILTIPDHLFFHRDHGGRFTRSRYDPKEVLAWYASERAARRKVPLGIWTLYAEGLRIIRERARDRQERWRCYGHLAKSLTKHSRWKKLLLHPILGVFPQLHQVYYAFRWRKKRSAL